MSEQRTEDIKNKYQLKPDWSPSMTPVVIWDKAAEDCNYLLNRITQLKVIREAAENAKSKIPLKDYSLSIGGFLALSALFAALSEQEEKDG